ncbi:MAG: hypothetical protein ACLSWI_09245 [Candidatus Gastranaerophilaceae bacterium]
MTLKVTPNQTIQNFSYSRRFVRGMASKSLAPLILLECFVTGGRTVQAFQRGGFDEGRERLTEESIGAAFWFAGVKMFNKMNDHIGKKLLNLHTTKFDVGEDSLRKPLKNFLKDDKTGLTAKQIAKFKFAKVTASILLANVLVGLVVPKINQSITVAYHKNKAKNNPQTPDTNQNTQTINQPKDFVVSQKNMDKFINSHKSQNDKDVSFNGIGNAQTLLSLANHFENDSKYQLLSTDVGIAGGRAVSARNNHERTEILFRDLTSIYFYMFNMPHINKWLNMIEDGRSSRLDPIAAKQVSDHMEAYLKENGGTMKADDFAKGFLGSNDNIYKMTPELNAKFEDKAIKLDTFIDYIKNNKSFTKEEIDKYTDLARRMSKLQPEIEGVGMLSKHQVKDIFREGAMNIPEFIQNIYQVATQEDVPFVKMKSAASTDPYKFVDRGSLEGLKDDLYHYVNNLINKAKKGNGEITVDFVKKACRENFIKNAFNWGTGFAVSALFLSTFIPKIQYWITKKVTGEDKFPGTTDYSYEKEKKKA